MKATLPPHEDQSSAPSVGDRIRSSRSIAERFAGRRTHATRAAPAFFGAGPAIAGAPTHPVIQPASVSGADQVETLADKWFVPLSPAADIDFWAGAPVTRRALFFCARIDPRRSSRSLPFLRVHTSTTPRAAEMRSATPAEFLVAGAIRRVRPGCRPGACGRE